MAPLCNSLKHYVACQNNKLLFAFLSTSLPLENIRRSQKNRSTCLAAKRFHRPLRNLAHSCTLEMRQYKSPEDNSEWMDNWYTVYRTVMPAETDYGGVVWHGEYFRWLEETRIRALNALGLNYVKIVEQLKFEFPVVQIEWKYLKPAKLGDLVCTQVAFKRAGIRLIADSRIYRIVSSNREEKELCGQGKISLVVVDMTSRQVVRNFPEPLQSLLSGVEN
ncbi:Putative esterase sll0410 [Galdieria sulphuraria]|nr:Putative esterase sll0410 [Galdieria sulphuraria]